MEEDKKIKIEEKQKTAEKAGDLKVEVGKGDIAVDLKEKTEVEAEKIKKIKKAKRQVLKGKAMVKCTYNNTSVSITDLSGGVLGWATSGLLGFKGAKKATPYAATQVVANVSEKVRKYGVRELDVFVKGVGSGREASIRALANNGFDLNLIKDITPIPHNGCRPKKPRRV
ncbi:MAG: small subunit ribosomal protein [Patescibacteria group bacterium]|nr:small subunit ribosomal protein [Patescibacteria group bacterium]